MAGFAVRRALLVALLVAAGDGGLRAEEWGNDVRPDAGVELIDWIRKDLAEIVSATPSEREARLTRFLQDSAPGTLEALKRFRNPELHPLFHRLLESKDWHVVHRALLALERCEDTAAFAPAWSLLRHPERRLREKAAITCLRFWGEPGAVVPADAAKEVEALLAREQDPHLRSCLHALAARASGSLAVERVSEEVRVRTPEGLVLTPFVRRMSSAREIAPDFRPRYVERVGEGSAVELPVVTRWTLPLLDYGKEDLPPGYRLQPFGHARNAGRTRHTGVDVGAFLDGAGLYACGDGLVKLVYTGSDMGTEIVVEHHVPPRVSPDGLACVLYMHAGDVVFVRAGDRVHAGQLLGSMGLGFSIENGGHFAHLHLGMYPGPFQPRHNYGYKPASEGLADWLDPDATLRDLGADAGGSGATVQGTIHGR